MTKETTTNFTKYVKWFWLIILGGLSSITLMFLLASWGAFGPLPSFEELENPKSDLATEVISSDGKTLGKYYIKANRTPIQYKDLSKNLVDALVATEDERFYEHSGIDFRGTARAVVNFGRKGGASTITQQLAKNLFHKRENANIFKKLTQKIKEWVIAIKLERQYTKPEIISMYLNTQGFLFNATGIRSAARIYFGKEPKDLDLQESAILVAMLKNPRQYNPYRERSKKKSLQRRNVVFSQMEKNGLISEKEKDSLQKLPLKINFTPESHSDGNATYFREHLRDFLKKWAKENPKANGKQYNIYKDGLKVYVTIDSRMQQYAEEAVKEHMANLQQHFFKEQKNNKTAPFYDLEKKQINGILNRAKKNSERYKRLKAAGKSEKEINAIFNKKTEMRVFSWKGDKDTVMSPNDSIKYYKYFLRSGLVAIEPQTGHIKAWVGGINNKHFKYDAVDQQKRQVGSTFKPFVYATAINQLNLSPCDKFPNTLYTIPKGKYGIPEDWTPKNSSQKYGGELSLRDALAQSVNVITARLIDKVAPENVARLAKASGIQSEIQANPSIALGAVELKLLEMVSAYATFANKGLRVSPMMITRIEDKNGTILAQFVPETQEVLSEQSAYVVLNLLKGVTLSGSGQRLRTNWTTLPKVVTGFPYKFTNPIAGKTGTTQNQSDGWFMGIVPNLATGVWTGGEERATHFAGISKGQGATMSLPSWALFMQKCYADKSLNISKDDFEKPSNLSINIDCSGEEPSEGDGKTGEENKQDEEIDF
ncbi:penicillin-binding protein 1A [Tenacibaculum maritimum]|uniref:penicillin-binding protein 1A n=1 Tax=Tenacibaculum maritimum TaxID=107401 RepID=UPI0012E61484|nr:transglycosylase domain-containing protein [Tenacibaculum maritimum]MCD9564229.1 transglycosylase domain-containing protein [Tenacibaculum maritimum]MCD9564588.1 transglycosylase domain-containing protein [Tenacibaculum maritimum]MCD9578318.1 transglycosylase domain-containing protein [Tenacibaculum maritimum]MCD9595456.1 transglycosylase domain-containing protein [Tenacibaculum maritimum]MCD9612670.1 transglycosylase domain-containing protein [Tenacibaculum maritimum]